MVSSSPPEIDGVSYRAVSSARRKTTPLDSPFLKRKPFHVAATKTPLVPAPILPIEHHAFQTNNWLGMSTLCEMVYSPSCNFFPRMRIPGRECAFPGKYSKTLRELQRIPDGCFRPSLVRCLHDDLTCFLFVRIKRQAIGKSARRFLPWVLALLLQRAR